MIEQVLSALVVPLANVLVTATGSWTSVLLVTGVCSLGAGLAAKFVASPMRHKLLAPEPVPVTGPDAIAAGVIEGLEEEDLAEPRRLSPTGAGL